MSPHAVSWLVLTVTGCVGAVADTDSSSEGPAPCPTFGEPEPVATVGDPALGEVSGLVASRAHTGVFWVHNDSGDAARFFAIDATGSLRGVFVLDGVRAPDIEDVALGPGPDGAPWLFLGDIGDNPESRAEIVVWGLPEPTALGGTPADPLRVDATAYRLSYPDGPRDAETLLAEPDGSLVVISKSRQGASGVYRARAPLGSGESRPLERVHDLRMGGEQIPSDLMVTAGDLTSDGRTLALRTYLHVWIWTFAADEPLEDGLLRAPCEAPSPPERQGEALGFDVASPSFWTLSEGVGQPLYRVPAR